MNDIELIREALNEEYSHRDGYGCEHLSKAIEAIDCLEANCLPELPDGISVDIFYHKGGCSCTVFDKDINPVCRRIGKTPRESMIGAIAKIEGEKK